MLSFCWYFLSLAVSPVLALVGRGSAPSSPPRPGSCGVALSLTCAASSHPSIVCAASSTRASCAPPADPSIVCAASSHPSAVCARSGTSSASRAKRGESADGPVAMPRPSDCQPLSAVHPCRHRPDPPTAVRDNPSVGTSESFQLSSSRAPAAPPCVSTSTCALRRVRGFLYIDVGLQGWHVVCCSLLYWKCSSNEN